MSEPPKKSTIDATEADLIASLFHPHGAFILKYIAHGLGGGPGISETVHVATSTDPRPG
jgi:hypothetical protein